MRVELYRAKNGIEVEIMEEIVGRFKWKKPDWNLWCGPYRSQDEALKMAEIINGINGLKKVTK